MTFYRNYVEFGQIDKMIMHVNEREVQVKNCNFFEILIAMKFYLTNLLENTPVLSNS